MNQSPFEHTTLTGSRSTSASESVEVRYPDTVRVLVPVLAALSGLIVPIILYFALSSPLNLIMGAAMMVMELGTAAFLWWLFNSSFVRADATGITRSALGKTTTLSWDEIANLEMRQIGGGATQIIFKNASGQSAMTVTNYNNTPDSERLLDYIESRLQNRPAAR